MSCWYRGLEGGGSRMVTRKCTLAKRGSRVCLLPLARQEPQVPWLALACEGRHKLSARITLLVAGRSPMPWEREKRAPSPRSVPRTDLGCWPACHVHSSYRSHPRPSNSHSSDLQMASGQAMNLALTHNLQQPVYFRRAAAEPQPQYLSQRAAAISSS